MGLTDREVEIIAQVARYHRKGAPKAEHAEFAALSTADQRIVRSLAGLLRVAIGLDRTYDARVKSVSTKLTADELIIAIKPRGKKADVSLNIYAANERKGLLSEVLQRKVKFTDATSV
jgi:exopolyphosphatase/guanosine-5'-triphosphate,3'-diphosphate pyrophosphatase